LPSLAGCSRIPFHSRRDLTRDGDGNPAIVMKIVAPLALVALVVLFVVGVTVALREPAAAPPKEKQVSLIEKRNGRMVIGGVNDIAHLESSLITEVGPG